MLTHPTLPILIYVVTWRAQHGAGADRSIQEEMIVAGETQVLGKTGVTTVGT
jgi:hypothetical protein